MSYQVTVTVSSAMSLSEKYILDCRLGHRGTGDKTRVYKWGVRPVGIEETMADIRANCGYRVVGKDL